MKKFIALALALVLALCCFAGCKKEESKGVIVVGYTLYAPMNYMENGELVGFDTELAKAVFEGMGYTVRFQEIDWNAKYTDLDSGNIDVVWNGMTLTDAVMEAMECSTAYCNNAQVVVTK